MQKNQVCLRCGNQLKKNQTKYCCNQCRSIMTARHAQTESRICKICGAEFIVKWFSPKITCSRKCGNILGGIKRAGGTHSLETRKKISESHKTLPHRNPDQAKALFQFRSQKMLGPRNPMSSQLNIEKMKNTKRINGTLHTWNGHRGGNGILTEPQILLALALGWSTEVVVPTGNSPGWNGFPSNYKVDIGNPELKIAIEIDGKGHNGKEAYLRDRKKEMKLQELGWIVLRFTNQEVMTNLSTVLLEIKKKIKDL